MALYVNAKGRQTHYNFSLFEVVQAMKGKRGRASMHGAIPVAHPQRDGFTLMERNGKPLIFTSGQMVVLYNEAPDEVNWHDQQEMNRRTFTIRYFEGDGRINLLNVLDSRGDEEIPFLDKWRLDGPLGWLRTSISGLNMLVDGIDVSLDAIPATTMQPA